MKKNGDPLKHFSLLSQRTGPSLFVYSLLHTTLFFDLFADMNIERFNIAVLPRFFRCYIF